jgi:cysteine synthase A
MSAKCYSSVIEMIGATPLLRLGRLSPDSEIYAKCEFMNPLSLKDRPVKWIIEEAERTGRLKPGGTVIEITSGNTGMAVAFLAAIKGLRAILVMSEIQSMERRKVLKAQHVNRGNIQAHYDSTGPELWEATAGRVDILVAGLGTGGTICGAGRFLKEQKPSVQLIAIEPRESPYISQGVFNPHRMMGTAPGFVPEILERELIDEILLVSEDEAFECCRELAQREGVLVGISSGATAHAALQVASRPENAGKVIVCVFADTGQRYLSVEGLY